MRRITASPSSPRRRGIQERSGDRFTSISRRCIADAVKARLELTETEDAVAEGDLAADTALRLDVADAMATLDERNRELIALRYGADLTARQIGELLGVKTNAVEVALHRALGRLRTELEAPAVDPAPAGKPLPTTGNS